MSESSEGRDDFAGYCAQCDETFVVHDSIRKTLVGGTAGHFSVKCPKCKAVLILRPEDRAAGTGTPRGGAAGGRTLLWAVGGVLLVAALAALATG